MILWGFKSRASLISSSSYITVSNPGSIIVIRVIIIIIYISITITSEIIIVWSSLVRFCVDGRGHEFGPTQDSAPTPVRAASPPPGESGFPQIQLIIIIIVVIVIVNIIVLILIMIINTIFIMIKFVPDPRYGK